MTQAEKMCENVSEELKPQAVALANALLTLQKKIKQQTPLYEKAPLAQEVKVGTGETVMRANPIVQEYRATVREYAQTLSKLQELTGKTDRPAKTDKNAKLHVVGSSKWAKRA
jgi:hypothetical protein